jgi:hypothetical protein
VHRKIELISVKRLKFKGPVLETEGTNFCC